MLFRAWRSNPPKLEISEHELEAIAPLLIDTGAAALGWWRIRTSNVRASPTAYELHQVHRLQTLKARIDQRAIEQVFKLLRSVNVEPILVKGWAVARLYPEAGLRPYGDIDLCVPHQHYSTARAILNSPHGRQYYTDLHKGFTKLGGGVSEEIYSRSQLVRLGEMEVRVLGPEDSLRIICFHMLREGAWRPLWLCDIAIMLESLTRSFDWDYCFAGTKGTKELVLCALDLAKQLLGACEKNFPSALSSWQLPGWVVPTVLNEWGEPLPSMARRHSSPLTTYVFRPHALWAAFIDRWPNAIEATTITCAPFNESNRIPFQLKACLFKTVAFIRKMLAISIKRLP